MEIKILNIRKVSNTTSPILAFLDVQIDSLIVDGMKIVCGKNGMFVSYPREQGKDQKWYDIVRPVDIIIKTQIETELMNKYKEWQKAQTEPLPEGLPPEG